MVADSEPGPYYLAADAGDIACPNIDALMPSLSSMPATGALRLSCALVLLVACSLAAAAQRSPQVIRGRVTTDSGVVIPGADIIVTIAPSAETVTGKSDSSGAYRVVITKATGEYLLYIGALGRKPFRQRVTIAATDSVAVVNASLAAAVATVAAVRVEARKARPPRSLGADGAPGTDATDKTVDGVSGALPPDLQGNLEAMASLIPGLSLGANGLSAFGLSADANSTTLNGLAFAGGDLPRDAQTSTRFRTSPWDPTVGGFAGVQTSASLSSGGNIIRRRGHITFDAPGLQLSDPVASRLGQKFTNIALDEGGTGAYRLDRYYYNFGIHAARQTASVSSLADLDPDALAHAGIAPDSAAHLVQLLSGMGVPIRANGIPRARTTNTLSFIERIDRAAAPTPANAPPGPVMAATVFGRLSQAEAQSLSPTVAPAFAGKSTAGLAGVQALYSRYFGKDGDYVSETTSGLSISTNRGSPYVTLPSGSVLVASDIGLGSLAFGGNSALSSDSRNWTWETINQTNLLVRGRQSLPIKVYLQSRVDGFDQSLGANRLGRFGFNSLADLAANHPSSFSRTLNAPDRSGGEWSGAAALGGNWINDSFTLTGGARLEANAFTAAPQLNSDVERLFGVRTDHAPNSFGVSPRFGFLWRHTKSTGYSTLSTGNATVTRGLATLRGGVGKFRSVLPSTLLSDAISSTGLPGGMQQLLCVGDAVPTPDWQRFASTTAAVPTTCAGGASTFADTARAVTLFDRGYQPAESWRANLGWTSRSFLKTYVAIDATYSLNLHQPGTIDLNFAGTPRFSLADEANRPMFVNAASVVPLTGSLSPVESRTSGLFGRVSERVSDLRSNAKQLTVYAIPNLPFNVGVVILGYTYVDARTQARGFDGSTAGDPRAVEWAPSSFTPRHQVTLQLSRNFFGGNLGVSTALRASSGFTYTPIVAGDISGDGSSNDRAFIFNPASSRDSAVTNGLQSLLRTGSSSARDCLTRQLGQIAARNSCVGPWYATMNGNVVLSSIPRTDNRARAFLSFANLPGALDELLHGNALRGWGLLPLPDQTLYQVRGFDAGARRFIYQVNPRFGSSSPATTTRRNPFRVTLDLQLDLGPSVPEQQVEQNIRVRPSMLGTRASADTVKARYLRSSFTDIYAVMLRFGDSLALSRDQLEHVQAQEIQLKLKADAIYAPLASFLVALPEDFDRKAAAARVRAASDSVWQVIYGERAFLLKTLTPGQIVLLPGSIRDMVTTPDYKGRFFYGF